MSLPPRPPNDEQPREKQSSDSVVEQEDVLDDTMLMTVVATLYAFFHVMSLYGVERCTC